MAIITYPLNDITYDASDVETYLCTRTSGVFDSDASFPLSVIGGRSVSIGAGQAWVKNADFKGKSICNTAPVTLTFDLADGSMNRYDRVVLRFDRINNKSELKIIKGTNAVTPTIPDISRSADVYDLGLYVVYMAAGATTVSLENITDTRSDQTVCGRMGDGVSGLNSLQQQIDKINHVVTGTLSASRWVNKTQAITVTGMTESSEFWYGYNGEITTEAQSDGWGSISSARGTTDAVVFKCYDDIPTVDIPVKIRGI